MHNRKCRKNSLLDTVIASLKILIAWYSRKEDDGDILSSRSKTTIWLQPHTLELRVSASEIAHEGVGSCGRPFQWQFSYTSEKSFGQKSNFPTFSKLKCWKLNISLRTSVFMKALILYSFASLHNSRSITVVSYFAKHSEYNNDVDLAVHELLRWCRWIEVELERSVPYHVTTNIRPQKKSKKIHPVREYNFLDLSTHRRTVLNSTVPICVQVDHNILQLHHHHAVSESMCPPWSCRSRRW